MEFQNTAQQETYERVKGYLHNLFGNFGVMARDDAPVFAVKYESAFVNIGVWPFGDDDSVISTQAWVITDVEMTPDLMQYLLQENNNVRFGAFGVDPDGDIFFKHAIAGSGCDQNELQASVLAVIFSADEYDDKIRNRWGGRRAIDRAS